MQTTQQQLVIAIDPGSRKCGVAVADMRGKSLELQLINRDQLSCYMQTLIARWTADGYQLTVVMGNGTQHKSLLLELQTALPNVEVHLVEEYGSTLAARSLYWQDNSPLWWQRLIPVSWRSTPPLDAYAAWVIAKRYINGL